MFNRAGHEAIVFSPGNNKTVKKKYYTEKIIGPAETGKMAYMLENIWLAFFSRSYYHRRINKNRILIRALKEFNPDIVITSAQSFNELLIKYKKDYNPDVKIIATTDDIRGAELNIKAVREGYRHGTIKERLLYPLAFVVTSGDLRYTRSLYKECIEKYDAITYVSHEDMVAAEMMYPAFSKNFHVIPPPNNFTGVINPKLRSTAKYILFLGNCLHKPSIIARNEIIKQIAPNTKDLDFILTGADCNRFKKQNIHSIGFVKNINKVVASSDICIAPLKFGSGLKVKILYYFSSGKPVIGTRIAFEGFPVKHMRDCIIEDDISKYPKILTSLSKNFKLRKKLSYGALKVSSNFSEDNINRLWSDLFSSLSVFQKGKPNKNQKR